MKWGLYLPFCLFINHCIAIMVLWLGLWFNRKGSTFLANRYHHLIDIYNRQDNINDNISNINKNININIKEIHTQLKSIIELNNGIKKDNKELVENYQKICDDLAAIITTINEKKTTRELSV